MRMGPMTFAFVNDSYYLKYVRWIVGGRVAGTEISTDAQGYTYTQRYTELQRNPFLWKVKVMDQ